MRWRQGLIAFAVLLFVVGLGQRAHADDREVQPQPSESFQLTGALLTDYQRTFARAKALLKEDELSIVSAAGTIRWSEQLQVFTIAGRDMHKGDRRWCCVYWVAEEKVMDGGLNRTPTETEVRTLLKLAQRCIRTGKVVSKP